VRVDIREAGVHERAVGVHVGEGRQSILSPGFADHGESKLAAEIFDDLANRGIVVDHQERGCSRPFPDRIPTSLARAAPHRRIACGGVRGHYHDFIIGGRRGKL
jgi:hypothetical protein